MPEPAFHQPEHRSLVVPILVAVVALLLAGAVAVHFFPATTINIDQVGVAVIPTQTVFKAVNKTTVIAANSTEDVLFIAETLRVDNQLRMPISVDDFSMTVTLADGRQDTFRAAQQPDLPNLETSFPQLKPALAKPLNRETNIEPKQTAQGTLLFSLPISRAAWDARRSATVKVDVYHQPSLYLTVPEKDKP